MTGERERCVAEELRGAVGPGSRGEWRSSKRDLGNINPPGADDHHCAAAALCPPNVVGNCVLEAHSEEAYDGDLGWGGQCASHLLLFCHLDEIFTSLEFFFYCDALYKRDCGKASESRFELPRWA